MFIQLKLKSGKTQFTKPKDKAYISVYETWKSSAKKERRSIVCINLYSSFVEKNTMYDFGIDTKKRTISLIPLDAGSGIGHKFSNVTSNKQNDPRVRFQFAKPEFLEFEKGDYTVKREADGTIKIYDVRFFFKPEYYSP